MTEKQTYRNLIGGEWVTGEHAVPDINPSDVSDIVGEFEHATEAQVRDAIAAARAAFPAWAALGIQQRADLLDKVGTEILARKQELGDLLSREEGKTLAEGIGEVLPQPGDRLPAVRPGLEVGVIPEPVGVIGLITPWNFPIAIPAWRIAPALAFGNCVVIKPAELVPGCTWALADIIHRAGFPAGVFNLVIGRGSKVGEVLLASPDVDAISFTGSVPVGHSVLEKASKRKAKVQLEMGGKNPLVVLDDSDLDTAVRSALDGAFFSTGQRCTASSRLIVQAGIHDRFVDGLREAIRKQVVDDARKPGTTIGPVVDQRQLDQNLKYVDIAKSEGAELVIGGERLNREKEGFYMAPALFANTHNDMRINREEVFGPVASVIRVQDYDEALHIANDTQFGLCAGICTRSLKHASHFKRNIQAGMVMVNLATAGVDYHVPFGGRKASSFGPREQGSYAKEFYTTVKTAYTLPG